MNNLKLSLILVLALLSCKKEEVPTVTTEAVTTITGTTAISGGSITNEGSGTVLSRGVCWSTGTTPTIADSKTNDGAGAGSFKSSMLNLKGATNYFVRAYATNEAGTGYGMAMSFMTLGKIPSAITLDALDIGSTNATLNGTINPNNLSTSVVFEYGETTSYGNSVNVIGSPFLGNSEIQVKSVVNNLVVGKVYHYRVKATNEMGTIMGSDKVFTYKAKDIDGNEYSVAAIGNQIWMKENLRSTKYRNGQSIPTTSPIEKDISFEVVPKYQWAYGGNEDNAKTYGRLYTWYAATDNRGVCPTGWHLPTDEEWTTLITFLGGEDLAGDKLKEVGYDHWHVLSSSFQATNESGFTALAAGYRFKTGPFGGQFQQANWWSSTISQPWENSAWYRYIFFGFIQVFRSHCEMNVGLSIRCIKDN